MSGLSSYGQGWLLYAQPEGIAGPGSPGLALSGNVFQFELIAGRSAYGPQTVTTARFCLAEPKIEQHRPLEQMFWEALGTWPDDRYGRRWPPQLEAMAELARRHPEEFRELCRERGASQLAVVPHDWVKGG